MKNVMGRLTGKNKSASTAKERLQLILIHDRVDLPQGVMDALRDELIEVISRHIDVNKDAVNIEISKDGRQQRLVAEIPLQQKSGRKKR